MPKVLEFQGNIYEMPDDITDEEMAEILANEASPPTPPGEGFSVVSPEEQEARDSIAAKIRQNEVGNDPKKIKANIDQLEEALEKRPMNADVRRILKRELSFWKRLETQ